MGDACYNAIFNHKNDKIAEQNQETLKQEMQQRLLEEYGKNVNSDQSSRPPYLRFSKIIDLAKQAGMLDEHVINRDTLETIRYNILHSVIPIDGSFKNKTMMKVGEPTALGTLLQIYEPIDTKKDRSRY